MRWIVRLGIGLVGVGVALAALLFVASEYAGEVVILHTLDAEGRLHATHLWIVEEEGDLWLRAGQAESGWYRRLQARPEVELERAGEPRRYRAVPMPDRTARINQRMAEQYGWVDRVIGLMRDPDGAVAVRLAPISP